MLLYYPTLLISNFYDYKCSMRNGITRVTNTFEISWGINIEVQLISSGFRLVNVLYIKYNPTRIRIEGPTKFQISESPPKWKNAPSKSKGKAGKIAHFILPKGVGNSDSSRKVNPIPKKNMVSVFIFVTTPTSVNELTPRVINTPPGMMPHHCILSFK